MTPMVMPSRVRARGLGSVDELRRRGSSGAVPVWVRRARRRTPPSRIRGYQDERSSSPAVVAARPDSLWACVAARPWGSGAVQRLGRHPPCSWLCGQHPPCQPGRTSACSELQVSWPARSVVPRSGRSVTKDVHNGADQRLCWSAGVWSPPPESNRRPHPYHVSPAHRHATRHLRSSLPSVGGAVMGWPW
jgi:hypothetical protein